MTCAGSTGSSIAAAPLAAAIWIPLLLCLSVSAVVAQESEDTLYVSSADTVPMGDLAPGAQIVTGGRPIGIGEAVALSIRHNLDIEVERFEPLIAAADSSGAWGAYDPFLAADFIWDVQKSPNTFGLNNVASNRQRIQGGGIGVTQLIPYLGATLDARYEASSVSTRSTIQSLNDQFNSSFFVSASVPLAQGLIWNEAWTNVKVSHLTRASARELFRASLMDNVQETVNAYWNLVAARDKVRVAQKSLDTARALLDQTKTQYEVGVVSRVEVVEAEAGVAGREFDVIRDANLYRGAQDALIDRVLGRELAALTDMQFSPSEDPGSYEYRNLDLQKSVDQAFERRPELAQARQEIESSQLGLKFAKNQRLPVFDLQAQVGYVGVSGEGNTRLNPAFGLPPQNRPFDQSDDNFFQGSGSDNYSVGAQFSIPFPNTTARKQVVTNELRLRRATTLEARLKQGIILEVRTAARGLLASIQGIEAAERRRLAAEEQLRAERIRLEHGESTPFEVLQRESDLVEAESQKIAALQTYRTAEVALERAQGTILDTHHIVLDEAARPTL